MTLPCEQGRSHGPNMEDAREPGRSASGVLDGSEGGAEVVFCGSNSHGVWSRAGMNLVLFYFGASNSHVIVPDMGDDLTIACRLLVSSFHYESKRAEICSMEGK